ncbi:hypothetical protein [Paenibacillus pinihumi]|uniref:hypothetical protein n=1 Tax=Paenibacillus pinihumi TaxID=669462 RepID=UPI00048D9E90|nr:hypothetical protein [Paenibacillus pinihumi]
MNLSELVAMRGFDLSKKIKLVRHQDQNYDTQNLYKLKMLDFYQTLQSNDVFGNCEYILSFLGHERTKAIYIGAYKVNGKSNFEEKASQVPIDYPYMEILNQPLIQYELIKTSLLDDFDRLVIEWRSGTRSWYQWLAKEDSKTVVEILPVGYVKDFPGLTMCC